MYTETLEQLLIRARTDKPGHMKIDDLVELAYKSGTHDEFYKQSIIITAQAAVLEECEKALGLLVGFCRAGELGFPEHLRPGRLIKNGDEVLAKIKALKDGGKWTYIFGQ